MAVLEIKLNEKTLRILRTDKYKLLVFKGIYTNSISIVKPLVWRTIPDHKLDQHFKIAWKTSGYYGFISNSRIIDGKPIRVESEKGEIQLGDELVIEKNRSLDINSNVTIDKLKINNKGTSIRTGLSDSTRLNLRNMLAVNLPGTGSAIFKPREIVLVTFTAKQSFRRNVYIKQLFNSAATVEYFNEVKKHSIRYDIDNGWTKNVTSLSDQGAVKAWFRPYNDPVHLPLNIANKIVGPL